MLETSQCHISKDGVFRWYNEYKRLHKLDGPAIIYPDGEMRWLKNGVYHCDSGPAIVCATGKKIWFLEGIEVTFSQFCKQLNLSKEQQLVLMLKYGVTK